jgi:hypothetical protein
MQEDNIYKEVYQIKMLKSKKKTLTVKIAGWGNMSKWKKRRLEITLNGKNRQLGQYVGRIWN